MNPISELSTQFVNPKLLQHIRSVSDQIPLDALTPKTRCLRQVMWHFTAFENEIYNMDLSAATIFAWPWPYISLAQSFLFRCFPWENQVPEFVREITQHAAAAAPDDSTEQQQQQFPDSTVIIDDDDDDDDDTTGSINTTRLGRVEYIMHGAGMINGAQYTEVLPRNVYCRRCIIMKLDELGLSEHAFIENRKYLDVLTFEELIDMHKDQELWCQHCLYSPLFRLLPNI